MERHDNGPGRAGPREGKISMYLRFPVVRTMLDGAWREAAQERLSTVKLTFILLAQHQRTNAVARVDSKL